MTCGALIIIIIIISFNFQRDIPHIDRFFLHTHQGNYTEIRHTIKQYIAHDLIVNKDNTLIQSSSPAGAALNNVVLQLLGCG